jgi:hypothetical protein
VADDVLGARFRQDLKDELRRQLTGLGVELLLASPLREAPPTEPGALQGFTVVTESGTAVTADIAGRQAQLVAGNIRALISGDGDLTPYQSSPPVIIVPIGPDGGSGQLPGSDDLATPERVAQAKGRDMMIDRFTELLGVTAPAADVGDSRL